MKPIRILAFAGSARSGSWNRKLLRIAVRQARELGAEVTEVDLGELNLPMFDEDFESDQGLPEGAKRLKRLMFDADGLLIACPEYNSSITPLLKNAIDWASRVEEGESPLQAYQGKVAALVSASPGSLGGLRGLVHVRSILGNIGVLVVPEQVAVGNATSAFNETGEGLSGEITRSMLDKTVRRLIRVCGQIS